MGNQKEPGEEESRELGGDRAASSASRSKYYIQVRSPDGVADHEWGPLEEVGGGWKGEWDDRHMGLYDDPVLVTLHGSGAGSTVGGGAEEDPIASFSS